jgi:hypothetical protein
MSFDPRPLHQRDFAQWVQEQARALRQGRFDAVDRDVLANELERMVSRERAEINNRLEAVTVQLLMWVVQPAIRTEAFQAMIVEQRSVLNTLLKASPSLRIPVEAALPRTYVAALENVEQAGISPALFPSAPPFTLDELVDSAFWPASLFGGRAYSF